jgi:hypothetical protein
VTSMWSAGRPNFTMKLVRPGFGPPAEPAAIAQDASASRRLQALIACTRVLAATGVPRGLGTRALAAQLIVGSVGRTECNDVRMQRSRDRLSAPPSITQVASSV